MFGEKKKQSGTPGIFSQTVAQCRKNPHISCTSKTSDEMKKRPFKISFLALFRSRLIVELFVELFVGLFDRSEAQF